MLRRGVLPAMLAASRGVMQSQRTIILLSHQAKTLQNIAEVNGYKSDIWVDTEGLWAVNAKPIDGAKPSTVQATKRIELYNESQLTTSLNLPEATANSSVASKKEYSGAFELDLEQHRARHGFTSRWWLGMGQIKTRGLALKQKYGNAERPVTMLMRVATHVYNTDQLNNPAAGLVPFSAYSMKPYMGENAKNLVAFCEKNGFKRRVFLTENQAKKFGVEVIPAATGCTLTSAMNKLYNVGDLTDPNAVLQKMTEAAGEGLSPVYTSGRSVQPDELGARLQEYQMKQGYSHSVWLGFGELRSGNHQLRDGVTGVAKDDREIIVFNAEQTSDPETVYKLAGTLL